MIKVYTVSNEQNFYDSMYVFIYLFIGACIRGTINLLISFCCKFLLGLESVLQSLMNLCFYSQY